MAEKIMSSSDGNFTLYKVTGVGKQDTPYESLKVVSEGLADKYVVEIRLDSNFQNFNGVPVHYISRA